MRTEADPGTTRLSIPYGADVVLAVQAPSTPLVYYGTGSLWKISTTGSQLGNRGWYWEDVLPLCKEKEKKGTAREMPCVARKGRWSLPAPDGATHVSLARQRSKPGLQLGLRIPQRCKRRSRMAPARGIGWFQQTRRRRRRASAAQSYLPPRQSKRRNLHIADQLASAAGAVRRPGEQPALTTFATKRGTAICRLRAKCLAAGAMRYINVLQFQAMAIPPHLSSGGLSLFVHDLPGVAGSPDRFLARGDLHGQVASKLFESGPTASAFAQGSAAQHRGRREKGVADV